MLLRSTSTLLVSLFALALSAACGDSGETGTGANGSGGAGETGGAAPTADDQTPPQNGDDVEAWLADGAYKNWSCEAAIHEARAPSPHGFNRICSNDLVAQNASGDGPWPKGAAAVKELYAAADDTAPVGYAVYLKLQDDSADGSNWYWYERVPLDSEAPHDAQGVVADGPGSSGPAQTICVGCHAAAGSDAAHTPSAGGRDQVYTPVP